MVESWEEKYDDLYRSYCRLESRNRKLEGETNQALNKLNNAEYRIKNELNPRIKQEVRSYDSWVENGGSDECFQNGMGGKCGEDCSVFGSKSECTQDIEDKELLTMYEDDFIEVGDELSNRGYDLEVTKIDLSVLKEKINILLLRKKSLLKDIWTYRLKRLFSRGKH